MTTNGRALSLPVSGGEQVLCPEVDAEDTDAANHTCTTPHTKSQVAPPLALVGETVAYLKGEDRLSRQTRHR